MTESLVQKLNALIKRNSSTFNPTGSIKDNDLVYSSASGEGVIARNLVDGIQDRTGSKTDKKLDVYAPGKEPLAFNYGGLPATLIHNNLITPNKVYPANDPKNGLNKPTSNKAGGDWNLPTLVAIKSVNSVIPTFTSSRTNKAWINGVFYPHDSNSVDQRAFPYWDTQPTKNDPEPSGFKAPRAFYKRSSDKKSWSWINDPLIIPANKYWQNGAGSLGLTLGNPQYVNSLLDKTNLGGTVQAAIGAGFHTNKNYYDISNGAQQSWSAGKGDLIDTVRKNGKDGLWDPKNNKYLGQVNTWWKTGQGVSRWQDFNVVLKNYINATFGRKSTSLISNQGWIDILIPWVTNPTDLINLTNRLYLDSKAGKLLSPGWEDRYYWGWNEIPTKFSSWNTRTDLTAFAFMLPYEIGDLSGSASNVDKLNASNTAWRGQIAKQIGLYFKLKDSKGNPLLKVGDRIVFGLTEKDKFGYKTNFVNLKSFKFKVGAHEYSISSQGVLSKVGSSFDSVSSSHEVEFRQTDTIGENKLGSVVFKFNVNQYIGDNVKVKYVDKALKNAVADYNNVGGLYRVVDDSGAVLDVYDLNKNSDTNDTIMPGEDGYYISALSQWEYLTGIKSGSKKIYDSITGTTTGEMHLSHDQLYAPFLIANGGKLISEDESMYDIFDDLISANPDNKRGKFNKQNIATYFSFKDANPDSLDHVMQRSDGSIGFEDLDRLGKSDDDFTDAIFKFDIIA